MGPRGKLPLGTIISEAIFIKDCSRRAEALKLLYGDMNIKDFVIYIRANRICLTEHHERLHKVRAVSYYLRDEICNDSLLVEAIIRNIHSDKIIKLIKLALAGHLPDLLPDINIKYPESYIRFRHEPTSDYKESHGIQGPKGSRGPGDDGYGGHCCGDALCLRKYMNDPLSLLIALFIHEDENLCEKIIEMLPSLKDLLPLALECFIVNKDIIQLKRITKYILYKTHLHSVLE